MLTEGLIKTPERITHLVQGYVHSVILGILSFDLDNLMRIEQIETQEDMEFFKDLYSEPINIFNQFKHKAPFIDSLKGPLKSQYKHTFNVSPNENIIPKYPQLDSEFDLEVIIKLGSVRNSASYSTFGEHGSVDRLEVNLHKDMIKVMGNDKDGNIILDFSSFSIHYKEIEQMIQHELMHMVQIRYLKHPEQTSTQGSTKGQNKDIDYFTSTVERIPYILSSSKKFVNIIKDKNITDKEEIKKYMRDYVGLTSTGLVNPELFFIMNLKHNRKDFNDIMKKFTVDVFKRLKVS